MPDVIRAGFDFFETDPWTTYFEFRDMFTLPAGLFDVGSEPVIARVRFRGVPIGSFNDLATGTADTVVQRGAAAELPPPYPCQATIPIEIVALSLVSTDPIAVKVGSQTQLWDVHVALSEVHAKGYSGSVKPQSQMTITKTDAGGGLFDSELAVIPRFDFVRVGDGARQSIDIGQLLEPGGLFAANRDQVLANIRLTGTALKWTHDPPAGADEPVGAPDQDFFACSVLPQFERGPFAQHGIHCGKKGGGPPPRPTKKQGCCDVCCAVRAEGHCGCFVLPETAPEQLIFVASHPGVAASPLGRDRVLAYITVSNEGPRSVQVFWDGAPPTYMKPPNAPNGAPRVATDQYALLLPGNSVTCAVGRALKLRYSTAAGSGSDARGCYVISWCCPPFSAAGTRGTRARTTKGRP